MPVNLVDVNRRLLEVAHGDQPDFELAMNDLKQSASRARIKPVNCTADCLQTIAIPKYLNPIGEQPDWIPESVCKSTRLEQPESVNLVDVNPNRAIADQAMLFAWSYQAGNHWSIRIELPIEST